MEMKSFPRTEVAGVSLPRMLIGTNWMAGWSHRTPAADAMIREHHAESATICPMLETFVNNGIDAIMGLFSVTPAINMAIKETEQKLGKKIIKIDTPIINVEDSAAGRAEAEAMIKLSKENGATFCLIHEPVALHAHILIVVEGALYLNHARNDIISERNYFVSD